MAKETIYSLLTNFSRHCAWWLCSIWYMYSGLWRKQIIKLPKCTPPLHMMECEVVMSVTCCVELASLQSNTPEALNYTLRDYSDSSEYMLTDHLSNVVNTNLILIKYFICQQMLFNKNQLETYFLQYHSICMNMEILPEVIPAPAEWDWPKSLYLAVSEYI